jgi:hypothetical protein
MGYRGKSWEINDLQASERYEIIRARPSASDGIRPHTRRVSPKVDSLN